MINKKKKCEPCNTFRKSLNEFLNLKWGNHNKLTMQMIEQDVIMFFEQYHKKKGCFYDK